MIGLKNRKATVDKNKSVKEKSSAQIASERLKSIDKTEYPRMKSELVSRMGSIPNGKVSSAYDAEIEFINDLAIEFEQRKSAQDASDLVPYIKYDTIENNDETILPVRDVISEHSQNVDDSLTEEDTLDDESVDDIPEIEML